MQRTHLDLFSGIGGFALACQWAGVKTIGFAEIDDYASRVLVKNFPAVPNYGDVNNVPSDLSPWLVTGGFPCQPFSVAGKQEGINDERYLWPDMFRVIRDLRPTWVLGENVPGFVKLGLDATLADLENEGYTARAFNIPAVAIGAPHIRKRIWIVAHSDSSRFQEQRRASADAEEHAPSERSRQGVADSACDGEWTGLCENEQAEEWRRRLDNGGSEGGAGLGYSDAESRLGRVANGLSVWVDETWERGVSRLTRDTEDRRSRLATLGNAIVPQNAYRLIAMMIEAEEKFGY